MSREQDGLNSLAQSARSWNRIGLTTNAVEFHVRVLTYPIPYDSRDAQVVLQQGWIEPQTQEGNSQGWFSSGGDPTGGPTGSGRARIMFRGRILQASNGLKPHALLKDPCKVSVFRDINYIYKLLQQHTLFVSLEGFDGKVPLIGDVVKVILKRSDFQGPNLQVAEFDELVDTTESETSNFILRDRCETLIRKMDRAGFGPSETAEDPSGRATRGAGAIVGESGPRDYETLAVTYNTIGRTFFELMQPWLPPGTYITSQARDVDDIWSFLSRKIREEEEINHAIMHTTYSIDPDPGTSESMSTYSVTPRNVAGFEAVRLKLVNDHGYRIANPSESNHYPMNSAGIIAFDLASETTQLRGEGDRARPASSISNQGAGGIWYTPDDAESTATRLYMPYRAPTLQEISDSIKNWYDDQSAAGYTASILNNSNIQYAFRNNGSFTSGTGTSQHERPGAGYNGWRIETSNGCVHVELRLKSRFAEGDLISIRQQIAQRERGELGVAESWARYTAGLRALVGE
jgi:hypothetical protein